MLVVLGSVHVLHSFIPGLCSRFVQFLCALVVGLLSVVSWLVCLLLDGVNPIWKWHYQEMVLEMALRINQQPLCDIAPL